MSDEHSHRRFSRFRTLARRPNIVWSGVILVPVSCLAAWFLCVDWSWFKEACPDCGYYADVAEYRLVTIPVASQVTPHPTVVQRIAADLGRPCHHPRLGRWHKHRWWGLCLCAAPCWNGTYSLDDQHAHAWYDSKAAKVRQWGAADPGLADEWHWQVIVSHNWAYRDQFTERLETDTE